MNAGQLERLSEHLLKLRLFKSMERLEALLQQAAEKELAGWKAELDGAYDALLIRRGWAQARLDAAGRAAPTH